MLNQRPARLVASQFLSNSSATLYTPAADVKYAIIREIALNNTDSVAHSFTISLGDPATTSNKLYDAVPIQAAGSEPPQYSRATTLLPGETIRGYADAANKVSVRISGIEYT